MASKNPPIPKEQLSAAEARGGKPHAPEHQNAGPEHDHKGLAANRRQNVETVHAKTQDR